jgi:mannose-6-phosphate isomerase-like protein (cupin superfamily)
MSIPITATTPDAHFLDARRQDKPWGHEAIFATGENGYVGKLITVVEGQALSLQYHLEKDETISIVTGDASLEHGPSADALHTRIMHSGDTVHLSPTVLHRITALTDVLFVEASTAAPGWGEDIVRLEDNYGRSGTTQA